MERTRRDWFSGRPHTDSIPPAMASVIDNRPGPGSPREAEPSQEGYIDTQIHRTRRALKVVDFAAAVITLVIGVLAYLLLLAVVEHWVVPGGLNTPARGTLFALLLGGVAWYSWRAFWPLLSRPINPAFAARTI